MGDIYEKCPNCNETYSKEPGFYYGAMYVSYAITVGMFLAIWLIFSIFVDNYEPLTLVLTTTSLILLTSPYLYALSKIIWANMFIKYDASKAK